MAKRSTGASIHFHFLTTITLSNRSHLKDFIRHLFNQESILLESITYIFCSDEYLAEINVAYLNHNTYTDIITFPFSKSHEPIISDIYISTDRVRSNAIEFQTTLKEELHRVIFHGALHLCGYNDKNLVHKARMRKQENYYLNQYFVSRDTVSKRNF